jgi:pimeloyl-ACP methyl ester carboxylesterase
VFGRSAPDLFLLPGWLSHADFAWRHGSFAGFLRGLASFSRVVLYDKRGCGLSDRSSRAVSMEERTLDVIAVLDAAGSSSAVLMGISEGAATALAAAVHYPTRVTGVVTYGANARMVNGDGFELALPPEMITQFEGLIREQWGDPIFANMEAPSLAGDGEFAAWLGEYMRAAASPREAIELLRVIGELDIRELAARVTVPALVLCRDQDAFCSPASARDLAARISNAECRVLPGIDHLPFVGDTGAVLAEVERFVRRVVGHHPTEVGANVTPQEPPCGSGIRPH